MNLDDRYQFVLRWLDIPEDFREDLITRYIERARDRDCDGCDGYGSLPGPGNSAAVQTPCRDCQGPPDPDDLHAREEAEEDIESHFPIYF